MRLASAAMSGGRTRLQASQAVDVCDWLPNDLLLKLDRCLMAHGVEGRTPFLDAGVAAAAFRLPDALKVQRHAGKWLLRQWLARHFPASEPHRPKQGFTVPVGAWIAARADRLGPLVARQAGVAELCKPGRVEALFRHAGEKRAGMAAWHLLDELKPKKGVPVHRMVFHEITKPAILAAVANPRQINDDLVEAQEARRILDRLYGYEVSPVLWKKVMSGLSAGRVQSVATRLVVDRERERMRFKVASYWDLDATFDAGSGHDPRMFPAKLYSIDGVRVARGADAAPRDAGDAPAQAQSRPPLRHSYA